MTRHRSGFTLVELMIALAILALVAVLGYRALAALVDSEAQLTAEAQHWRDLDGLFARIEADMRDALPRDVRTDGGTEPAWVGDVDDNGNADLRFSRAGPEFGVEPGSAGQRIGYRLRSGAVEVLYWPRLDQPSSVFPRAYVLATRIGAFRVEYLDARGSWRERWPAPAESPVPRAVRIGITFASGEEIERWLALR
jgi:general secretion pathway protein J